MSNEDNIDFVIEKAIKSNFDEDTGLVEITLLVRESDYDNAKTIPNIKGSLDLNNYRDEFSDSYDFFSGRNVGEITATIK